ncbi:MAG: methylated-DNA--[protein]-cysteine S-methyltransferase [Methanosarcinaceae archaeon]|nr:methylated-DNA--[protein]-cysteine S-methyltransferase [Methanosarcinaceae archaeon]
MKLGQNWWEKGVNFQRESSFWNSDKLYKDISRYLMGENVDFLKYEPNLSNLTEFEQAVLNEVRKVPYGMTVTYSELADRIGSSGGARAVGQALSKNPYPIVIPCHRVVAKNSVGGYGGGLGLKKKLLDIEQ